MKHPMLQYLKETGVYGDRFPTIFCPGCGIGQVLNYALNAVDHLVKKDGIPRDQFCFIAGIGCSARVTSQYLGFDAIWSLHGRAPAVATGALLARPELRAVVITGDGDVAAIGGNHFIHACRRNLDMTILCMNNNLYGMTGGQSSPTTLRGIPSTTSPYGNVENAFDLCQMAITAGASYVARWTTAHPQQCIQAIEKGIRKKGLAFIEVMTQCPTHWKEEPAKMMKKYRSQAIRLSKEKERESLKRGQFWVGEFVDKDQPEWLESYQKIIDRFQNKGMATEVTEAPETKGR
ncbi:MAG: thiamine pyrophosphate-dependent enzyme [Deltaproteobacteria bacterium]|nr:thiamine pyrophosphate-dependent enzyme [Deltaproteobacteria bacterium]